MTFSQVREVGGRLGETRTLADLLIMPIQRPPRYLMYLERISAILGRRDDDGGDDGEDGGDDAASAVARAAKVVRSSAPSPPSTWHAPPSTCHAPPSTCQVGSLVRALNERKRESDRFAAVRAVQRRLDPSCPFCMRAACVPCHVAAPPSLSVG